MSSPKLIVVDRPGEQPVVEHMRRGFEHCVKAMPELAGLNVTAMILADGSFRGYSCPLVDAMWRGFALGLRFCDLNGHNMGCLLAVPPATTRTS